LLAAENKSNIPVESLIVPRALVTADKMLDKKYANATKTIASSDTTAGRRINDMAQDVV
jgi:hypothetical protein